VIAHLDLDAFFAAVELHRRPELRGRPVVVGGEPDSRGVVATASYAAREYGIRSAMSSAEARRRCPEVVFVPPDHAEYRRWSERVWVVVEGLVPTVEQVGIDEGYLALLGRDPRAEALAVQRAVAEEVRLSCSLGVAAAKVVAKIASDRDKPGGLTVVPAGGERAFLAPLPLRALPGAGPRTQERLASAGVTTIGGLADLDDEALRALLPGQVGEELRRRARGIDPREVRSEPTERVSISTERTFARDVGDRAELAGQARRMAGEVAERLRSRGQAARIVRVKLRFPDFRTLTRAQTLPGATDEEDVIAGVAARLLAATLEGRREPLRLLGVGVSGLVGQAQLTLF